MPKAKTTKRTASGSSSKASVSSRRGLLGKSFSLKSRKVQFFVTIFIIAVIGGGYFTFKSFAASGTAVITYTVANNQLTTLKGKAAVPTNDKANKGGAPVLLFDPGTTVGVNLVNYTRFLQVAHTDMWYSTCALIDTYFPGNFSILGPGSKASFINVNSSGYKEYCNAPASGKNLNPSSGFPSVVNETSKVLAISSIYIVSQPAPGPAK